MSRNFLKHFAPLLALLLSISGFADFVHAETLQDFDQEGVGTPFVASSLVDPICPPQVRIGGPTGEGRFMRLAHGLRVSANCMLMPPPDETSGDNNVNAGSIAFERTDEGAANFVVADFDLRLAPSTGRADGVGFALLETQAWGTDGPLVESEGIAEEPNFAASLGIGFDIFESGDLGDIDENHVSIHYNNVRIKEVSARDVFDIGGSRWFHVRVIVDAQAGEVSVVVTPCGGRPVVLVDAYEVAGLIPYEARAYFAGRSGGITSDLEVDNIRVQFFDSPPPAMFSIDQHIIQALETDTEVVIEITRSMNLDQEVSVFLSTDDLTARAGTGADADYRAVSQPVNFEVGQSLKTVSILLADDDLFEDNERFRVFLHTPTDDSSEVLASDPILGGPIEAVVTIIDDETARVTGSWSPVACWPIVPIHLHMLPTGSVLGWGREIHQEETGTPPIEKSGPEETHFDRIRLWDPISGELSTPALPPSPHNPFCSGHNFLPDGRLFVAGGAEEGIDFLGLPDTSIYNPWTDQWSVEDLMGAGRWYPTTTAMPNGDVAIESGSIMLIPPPPDERLIVNELAQVFARETGLWRNLPDAELSRPNIRDLYPRLLLAPDGRLFKAGPDRDTWFLDTRGAGTWSGHASPDVDCTGPMASKLCSSPLVEPVGSDPSRRRDFGAAVIGDGVVMMIGGADPPTAQVDMIDLNESTPEWRPVGSMNFARRHLNATWLPDGTILASGGSSAPTFNDGAGAVLHAELWNPESESWRILSPMQTKRVYHSTSVLLPDGRVLIAGGGQPNASGDADHADIEVFSPPYLFKGPRPTITSAPTVVTTSAPIEVVTPDAESIDKVTLIRLGSTTHAFDQSQRFVSTTHTQIPGGLGVTISTDPRKIPPGPYMLFLVDDGVPSVGAVILVEINEFFSDGFEGNPP